MRNLKRALSLALASVMLVGMMVVGASASYEDVDSSYNVEAIEVLQAVGIMVGDDNGNFNPDSLVTRNEMAVVMSNLMDYRVASYAGTSPFTDVPAWAEPYVAACWTNGITSGYTATTYGGSDSVTAAQAALMLMKALGYFQYQSDFEDDWQLAAVKQANKIDLFEDVEAGVQEAMTRNDLAQLVLNALESGLVEADNDTTKVEAGDIKVETGSVKYYYQTSEKNYASAIGTETTLNLSGKSGTIIELGEKLYNGDLEREGTDDDFGRPAAVWTYKSKEIGTYADEADKIWTGKVTEKALYQAAGSAAYENYKWTVKRNGDNEIFTGAAGSDVLAYGKTSSERWQETGDGVLTELYVDSETKTVVVTIIDQFVAEVTKVVDNGEDYTVTISYKGDKPSGSETQFDTDKSFSKEDIVVVTIGSKEIQSMAKAEIVEGTVTSVKDNDYVYVDGSKYAYNRAYTGTSGNRLGEGLVNLDSGDKYVNPDIDNDVVVYLDIYGAAVAIEGADDNVDDYLYVTGVDEAFGDYTVKAVFTDGREEKIDIDEVDGKDASESNKPVKGSIYKYSESGSSYDLESASYASFKVISLTNGKVERNNASILNDGSKVGTANSDTIFINCDDEKMWVGYKKVSSQDGIVGAMVEDDGVITVMFMASSEGSSAEDDDFVFLSGKDPEVIKENGDTLYKYNDAYINGEKVDGGFITSKDLRGTINTKGLYKVETRDTDDYATKVSLVVNALDNTIFDNYYSTYAEKGILTLSDSAANLTEGTQTDFAYDDDTIFVVVELKNKNDSKPMGSDVDSVSIGGITDIETYDSDNSDITSVYVITVDDDGDDTPLAEVVLVIVPDI